MSDSTPRMRVGVALGATPSVIGVAVTYSQRTLPSFWATVYSARGLALHGLRDALAHGVAQCGRHEGKKPIVGHDPRFTGKAEQLERLFRSRHDACHRIEAP